MVRSILVVWVNSVCVDMVFWCVAQLLNMETERFAVPEVLFCPSMVGLEQAGIAEATWQSLRGFSEVWVCV